MNDMNNKKTLLQQQLPNFEHQKEEAKQSHHQSCEQRENVTEKSTDENIEIVADDELDPPNDPPPPAPNPYLHEKHHFVAQHKPGPRQFDGDSTKPK